MAGKKLLEESTIRRFMQLANIKPLNENGPAGGPRSMAGGERSPAGGRSINGGLTEKKHVEEELEEGYQEEGKMEEKRHHAGKKVEEKKHPGHAKKMEEKRHHGHKGKVEEKKRHMEEELEEARSMEEDLEENLEELGRHRYEENLEEEEELGGGMEAGAPEGMEGGELSAVEELASNVANLLNDFLEQSGSTKKIAQEPSDEEPADMDGLGEPEGEEPEGEEDEEEDLEEGSLFEGLLVEDDEALAEELTRRVAARLVREMKAHKSGKLNHGSEHVKGHSMVKKGQTGEKAATGGGTKHHAGPKAGGKPTTGHLKPAVASKSAKHPRNKLPGAGALKAGK